jgi:alpha-ketoglutarate-dependent taurine dioxygenase
VQTERCVNLLPLQPELRLEADLDTPLAWSGTDIGPADWTLPLGAEAAAELRGVAEQVPREPLPTYLLEPGHFALPACAALAAEARRRLEAGIGLVLLDGFPLDGLSEDEVRAAYWVFGRLLALPVAAKWDGTVLYDVRDSGREYGIGVRASLTASELEFHTDNTFAHAPPDYVSLLCIRPAAQGGVSRVASFYALHNRLRAAHPGLLERLYGPFYYDRQLEHPPEEPRVSISRAFCYDGRHLRGRLSYNVMRQGYALMGETLDAEGQEALDTAYALLNAPGCWIEHTLQRGQLQILNNRALAHYRSRFVDADDPARKRHLLRLWYRTGGRPFFNG